MSTLRKFSKAQTVTWLIRLILIGTVLFVLSMIAMRIVWSGDSVDSSGVYFELLYQAIIVLVLSFIPDYLERRRKVILPRVLELTIVLFMFSTVFVGDGLGLYDRFWWWDDLAHAVSGVIIGFLGFLLVGHLNYRYQMNIKPIFIALFAFCIATTLGVLWEIFEFAIDVFLGTPSQRWNLPPDTVLMGRPYQGSGLRDTMSDLIINGVGALISSVYMLYFYANNGDKLKSIIQKIFPREAK